jgi:putative holliday junction resolvase
MYDSQSPVPSPQSPPPGKILALDVGEARIGVATCDPLGLTVRPVTVIQRKSRREDFDRLAALIRQEGVETILCGLPLNMDGSEGPQAATTRKWAGKLVQALKHILGSAPPLLFWDERLSSFAADEILEESARGKKKRIGQDAVAAAVILQDYLDAQRRNASEDYGRIG